VALSAYLGIYGLTAMIELGPWRARMLVVLALVTGSVMLTRMLSRSRALPTAVGAVVGFLACIPAFARGENGEVLWLPTPGSVGALAQSVRDAIDYAATTVAPAPMTLELLSVFTMGLIALFLVAEHLAVSWRAAASSGLLLMMPWMPAVVLQHRVSTTMLIVAIGSWVLTLGLTKRLTVTDRVAVPGPALLATVASMLLVILIAPTALGGNGWGMIPRIATPNEFDTATRLNLALDLRNSLTSGADSPVMLYVTTGDRPEVLRLYALTDFDGAAWDREDPEPTDRAASGGVLWPTAVDGWNDRDRDRLNIQVLNLAETNLPVPAVPRTVDVDSRWSYVSGLDEIVTEGNGTQNLTYSVVADLSYFDAAVLSGMANLPSLDPDAGVGEEFIAIAPAVDLERIRSLAQEITADSQSRYDQALAIQTYLRDPDQFTYDTSVQPEGADTVSTFLDEGSGYCVQFATAMVTMMRSLDVPARLAVGFLPGNRESDGAYVVYGGDAHAWPEVWFPEVGWVRFEPTPSAQTGATPTYANPDNNEIPVPQSVIDAAQNGQPAPVPSGAPEQGQGRPETSDAVDQELATPWWVIAGGALVVVLLAVGLTWWLRARRKAIASHLVGPEAAWMLLRERVGEDIAWPLALTPHEAGEHVVGAVSHVGAELSPRALESLLIIVNAVSDHRYAPQGTEWTEAHLREHVAVVEREVREATGEATGRPARGGARIALRA
jgi:transglutaminase-like putative cysteine protease